MTRTTAMVYNMMNILSGFALMSALRYLSRMSFLTVVTPDTPRVISTALSIAARELTKPLNCTTPLKVSTLISADFSVGSLKTAVFTLVVMTVSSTYSPVPSCLGVEAHPRKEVSRTAKQKVANRLHSLMVILLMHDESMIPLYRPLSMNGHDQEEPLTTLVSQHPRRARYALAI